jgi:hypothetical protein
LQPVPKNSILNVILVVENLSEVQPAHIWVVDSRVSVEEIDQEKFVLGNFGVAILVHGQPEPEPVSVVLDNLIWFVFKKFVLNF